MLAPVLAAVAAAGRVGDAPQLPSGYALMICLGVVPPLWHRVMDHQVLARYGAG